RGDGRKHGVVEWIVDLIPHCDSPKALASPHGSLARTFKKTSARRKINGEFGVCQLRSQMREVRRSPAAAIGRMLGLTPRPGQANAKRAYYDFSLGNIIPNCATIATTPEITISDRNPLDAFDCMADRSSLFPFRG